MTAMPQLVALFNGVGGGAAAIVAFLELKNTGGGFPLVASLFTIVVGCDLVRGSVVTFLKLQEVMTTRPVVLPGHPGAVRRVAGRSPSCCPWWSSSRAAPTPASTLCAVVVVAASLAAGVLFVLPVGGADVPIVISLLNAFTGLAVAASGYVLGNVLLLIAGTLVGASGTLLTRLMATGDGPAADVDAVRRAARRVDGWLDRLWSATGRCARPRRTTSRSCSTTRTR